MRYDVSSCVAKGSLTVKTTINRRHLLAGSAAAIGMAKAAAAQQADPHAGHMGHDMPARPMMGVFGKKGAGPGRPVIAMLIHPKMVLQDLVGPLTVFNIMHAEIHLVWKSLTPVPSEMGIPIMPSTSFADCPKYVTSVCTGALVLGAAGLLKGYKATTLWNVRDVLPLMGAKLTKGRVVQDRNRITGGGVTAGIDFGLTLCALLKGRVEAERVQLTIEYAPAPPFNAGEPETAPKAIVERLLTARAPVTAKARAIAAARAKTFL
jgi:cyclohexyl-isocyanide hydratase